MEEKPKQISEAKAFSRMSHLCAKKECCVYDIETKLNRFDLDTEIIERIINQLKKEKYIDELRFTKSFIHDKVRFNKWGKIKIEYALRQKRISESTISEAFSNFSDEELTHSLQDLMQAKWETIKGSSIYERQNKLIRFAMSRGFEMKDILYCMKKIK
ncbi:MAG TPA: regulatory protein RecX [Dysgonamonadaceae bacterium]|jgi:regulatory protein|nr:regulatory protein RecX [Dysgonamonadaceae bacterium]